MMAKFCRDQLFFLEGMSECVALIINDESKLKIASNLISIKPKKNKKE